MVTGKGYGRWLRDVFVFFISLSFSFWEWLREMVTESLWEMVTGDGYGKSSFSFFS